jgi:hypothetical protein
MAPRRQSTPPATGTHQTDQRRSAAPRDHRDAITRGRVPIRGDADARRNAPRSRTQPVPTRRQRMEPVSPRWRRSGAGAAWLAAGAMAHQRRPRLRTPIPAAGFCAVAPLRSRTMAPIVAPESALDSAPAASQWSRKRRRRSAPHGGSLYRKSSQRGTVRRSAHWFSETAMAPHISGLSENAATRHLAAWTWRGRSLALLFSSGELSRHAPGNVPKSSPCGLNHGEQDMR